MPGSMLDFSNSTTWGHQTLGRKDGSNAINHNLLEKFDEWTASLDLQKKYPRIGDYIKEV